MNQLDTRPKWMLAKQARTSQRRLARFGVRPDKLDPAAWWQQIVEAAAELGLEPGAVSDWQAWPVAPVDNSDPL